MQNFWVRRLQIRSAPLAWNQTLMGIQGILLGFGVTLMKSGQILRLSKGWFWQLFTWLTQILSPLKGNSTMNPLRSEKEGFYRR